MLKNVVYGGRRDWILFFSSGMMKLVKKDFKLEEVNVIVSLFKNFDLMRNFCICFVCMNGILFICIR